jgi:hypothetical protein
MATTIKLKSGSGAPLAGDLVAAEPAFDLTNKRLYTEDSGGTVIEVGTNPSTIDINAGTIDGTVIGGSSAAAGTFTTFTSTGIDDNATSTAITIDSSQNVGIGKTPSTSPNHILDVSGGASDARFRVASSGSVQIIGNAGTGGLYIDSEGSASDIIFRNTGSYTERMRIDSSGNVGIGTTSPSTYSNASELVVDTGTAGGITVKSGTAGYGALFFADGTNGNEQYRGFIQYNHNFSGTIDSLILGSAGTERMRIDSSGNVGIGTTTIFNPLTVKLTPNTNSKTSGSAFDGGAIRLTSSTGLGGTNSEMAILAGGEDSLSAGIGFARQSSIDWGTQIRFYTHGTAITTADELTERMRLDASGNLLVGTTTTTGDVSSTRRVIGGIHSTASASALTLANNTATTIFTIDTTQQLSQVWLVSADVAGQTSQSYACVYIVTVNYNGSLAATQLVKGSLAAISVSGANVQYLQASGGTQTSVQWNAIRIM